ncbi:DUF1015 domain-containing protein [Treponema sp. OttesenSCG-928-L16]|nr:DUF1015 domain-containing protein [Treponema sp. OttesenSCG-928-L16]
MPNIDERLSRLGTAIPEILIPRPGTELEKWAVIACDQYTQDQEYWHRVQERAGSSPSALNLIFPEIYLENEGRKERIASIHHAMEAYINGGTFSPPKKGLIYIERSTPLHPRRRGLLLAVDLEQYNWQAGSRPLIRATEGTVPERIPPRVEIRRGAPLESPHIILLIDDEKDSLLSTLGDRAQRAAAPIYESSLMEESGQIRGWFLGDEDDWTYLAEGLEDLASAAPARYGTGDAVPFLYAVGDGNHSLATAKAVWEEYKQAHAHDSSLMQHPARWALVELENLYDPGIAFEPIHRIIFGASLAEMRDCLSLLPGFSCKPAGDRAELSDLVRSPGPTSTRYGLTDGKNHFLIESAASGIATDALQPLLDDFIQKTKACSIDYIHGEDELFRLADPSSGGGQSSKNGDKKAAGILLPPIKKEDLFKTVAKSGPLPRKSFSMGEAFEKRFYLECRRLFG